MTQFIPVGMGVNSDTRLPRTTGSIDDLDEGKRAHALLEGHAQNSRIHRAFRGCVSTLQRSHPKSSEPSTHDITL